MHLLDSRLAEFAGRWGRHWTINRRHGGSVRTGDEEVSGNCRFWQVRSNARSPPVVSWEFLTVRREYGAKRH
jgi:hypothetical protein